MSEILQPRILVLDDEAFMLRLITTTLARLGFTQVTGWETGHRALEAVDDPSEAPDIILCDLNMPEMNGVEFLRELVDHRFTGSIILISGEAERMLQMVEKLVRAHRITLLGHLRKPVLPAALAALLKEWAPATRGTPRAAKRTYEVSELRAALANGELINYYQPKVAVKSGKVIGAETLVRWRHPGDGMVFPDQFIGVAEDHGLINELTNVVLGAALTQARIWQDLGLTLPVAINVSMDNLTSIDFVNVVSEQAAKAGVAPDQVILELTESRLMKDIRVPLEVLARLRLRRFSLSIDDFGTGHSSLSQLRDIPFDELKIDRGFVHGAWADETVRAIYDASCLLARQLGMKIVAEGVEDQRDWDFLRRTGCDLAQGYFIARPMPAADIPDWIEAWHERKREWNAVAASLT